MESCLLSLIPLAAISIQISNLIFASLAAADSLLAGKNLILTVNLLILHLLVFAIGISTKSLTVSCHLLLTTRFVEL